MSTVPSSPVRKGRKPIRRSVLGLALFAIATAFIGLDLVDYRPYFRESYYQETTERIRSGAASNQVVRGALLAGFGRAHLTPEINAPADDPKAGKFRELALAGYGNRNGRPATGVHDDLFVKAVALRVGSLTGIIFGTDALIVPREVADAAAKQLRDEFGLARESLYFSATHSHCSIGGWGEGFVGESFAGKFDPGARTWFTDRLVTAARAALADLKPAEFGHGIFQEPQFVRNRLDRSGAVNTDFSFLVVRQTNGQSAIVGSYAAHATVLPGRVMEFSADYPGYWQRAVESATGGYALFVAGSVGSHGPVASEGSFAGAESMGTQLAKSLLENMKAVPLTNTISFGVAGVEVSLPEFNVRIAQHIRLRQWLTDKLLRVPNHRSFLQAFRMNDALWISTPCDFSGELALETKNYFKVRGVSANITSFNGDYIGYVVRPRYYYMDGYEPRLMSFYGPYTGEYLTDLMRSLSLTLIENR